MISMNKVKGKTVEEKTKIFIDNANEVHNFKYDYSKANYKHNKEKMNIICPIHGVFYQNYNMHIVSKKGCPKCGFIKSQSHNQLLKDKSKINFFKKANKIFNDKYNYSKFEYENTDTKGIIICPIHGEFLKSPNKHINRKQGCPLCSKEQRISKGELIIKNFLKKFNFTVKYNKDNKKLKCLSDNNNFLDFDFYILEKNLLIEFDGEQHFKNKYNDKYEFERTKKCDDIRNKWCKKNKYNFLRISFKNKENEIKDIIQNILDDNIKKIKKYDIYFLDYTNKKLYNKKRYYKNRK